jgi:hypothetical protein
MPREEMEDDDDAAEQSRKTPSPLSSESRSKVILLKLFSHLPFVVKKLQNPSPPTTPQRGTTINATHVMGDVVCRTS